MGETLTQSAGPTPRPPVDRKSKLFASIGATADALDAALKQAALADIARGARAACLRVRRCGGLAQLDGAVARLRAVAPGRASTHSTRAVAHCSRAISLAAAVAGGTWRLPPIRSTANLRLDRRGLHQAGADRRSASGVREVAHVRSSRQRGLPPISGLIALAAGNRAGRRIILPRRCGSRPSRNAREGLARAR